ncbi:hypothetical protein DITRI_Ditri17bG0118100 [Diplodiscus trichospermus]
MNLEMNSVEPGVSAMFEAEQYGKDVMALKKLVKELRPDRKTQPKILGPGGFYEEEWFKTFLQVTGPEVLDGTTHHIYNLGLGDDSKLITKILDPFYLSQIAQTFKDVSYTVNRFAPWSGVWVSESGGAYNSGGKHVSHTFANGYWFVDQLGMTATYNHKVHCRQALIGRNYAVLNTSTFIPNPDYYGALLWHRLMGSRVLGVTLNATPNLRVYAHCAKKKPGISLVLINLSKDLSYWVNLAHDLNLHLHSLRRNLKSAHGVRPNFDFEDYQNREEYHLTPKDGNIQSDVVLSNGTPLKLRDSSDIPNMNLKHVDGFAPISVAARSIVFATIRDFRAPSLCLNFIISFLLVMDVFKTLFKLLGLLL